MPPVSSATAVSAGLKESMRQAELNNWSLDAAQMADLCSSINQFFTTTGVIPPQGSAHPQPQVQHQAPPGAPQHGAMHAKGGQHGQHNQHINTGQANRVCLCARVYANLTATVVTPTGNMYMDTRQNISSLMGPPGYPHMPPMSNTAPAMTGDLPPPPTSFGCQYSKCWSRSMPAVMFIARGVRYCGAMSGTRVSGGTAAR